MNKKHFFVTLIVFISFISSFNLFQRTVSASQYREVRVTKPVKIYKMKIGHPLYKTHAISSKTLKKGQKVKIQDSASYAWIVTHKGWSNGYFKSNGKYFWQCPTPTGWYQLIK